MEFQNVSYFTRHIHLRNLLYYIYLYTHAFDRFQFRENDLRSSLTSWNCTPHSRTAIRARTTLTNTADRNRTYEGRNPLDPARSRNRVGSKNVPIINIRGTALYAMRAAEIFRIFPNCISSGRVERTNEM